MSDERPDTDWLNDAWGDDPALLNRAVNWLAMWNRGGDEFARMRQQQQDARGAGGPNPWQTGADFSRLYGNPWDMLPASALGRSDLLRLLLNGFGSGANGSGVQQGAPAGGVDPRQRKVAPTWQDILMSGAFGSMQ
jgi:hypothetical protein